MRRQPDDGHRFRPGLRHNQDVRSSRPDDADSGKTGVRPLNDFELATRLSYFLWGSVPDRELSQLAEKGLLRDEKVLDAQIRRMMRDWRSRDGLLFGFLL